MPHVPTNYISRPAEPPRPRRRAGGMRAAAVGLLAGLVACAAIAAGPAREVTDEDVNRAMAEAKRFLWSQQTASGHWRRHYHQLPDGGDTAIALFALLEAGESPNSPQMRKGLQALADIKTNNLYVITTRVMVLSQAGGASKGSPYREQLEKDLNWLTRNARGQGAAWGYGGPERTGDNSCSQFALLALWEADRAGLRIHPGLIGLVERTWLRRQQPDGGWTYPGQGEVETKSTLTMTTAGLASLFVCQDVLTQSCRPYAHQRAVDAAWKYLNDDLKGEYYRNGYLAFCVQRVGMASGRKFIGAPGGGKAQAGEPAGMDWFAVGAAKLAEPNPAGRSYQGQWGPVVRSAFELIFLARGRNPLTFNKLAYGEEAAATAASRQVGWNAHTRDVPHFTEYMRRNFERRMRWQVVNITDNVQPLLDAPILLVAGTKAPQFTPRQWAKLREYTLRGGTLLMVPTHGSKEFLAWAKEGLATLYAPQRAEAAGRYTLQPLPADHPVYSVHQKIPNGPKVAPMWGVSDGTRLLAVVCGRDITCSWQRRAIVTGRLDYLLGVNFFLYATGANSLRMRLRPVFVGAGGAFRHRAKVAWIRHGGNWNTQPYALDYLSAKLTAENRVGIETSVGAPLEAESLKGRHLAWMTGAEAFALGDAEREALRAYLDSGGTLFVNAVGGSREFAQSAEAMLEKLFAADEVLVANVEASSPLATGRCGEFRGPALERLPRTRAWTKVRAQAGLRLRLYRRAGRAVVIYAPFGVHDTLDGHTAHEAMSYMPTAARDIAANVVLYALMAKPTSPQGGTSKPAAGGPAAKAAEEPKP